MSEETGKEGEAPEDEDGEKGAAVGNAVDRGARGSVGDCGEVATPDEVAAPEESNDGGAEAALNDAAKADSEGMVTSV